MVQNKNPSKITDCREENKTHLLTCGCPTAGHWYSKARVVVAGDVFLYSSIHSPAQSLTVDLMRTWWSFVNAADIADTFRIDWPCLQGKPARGNMISLRHHHQLCDTWEIPGSSELHSEPLFSSQCLGPEQSSMSSSCEQRLKLEPLRFWSKIQLTWTKQGGFCCPSAVPCRKISALFLFLFFPWLMFQTFHAEDSVPVEVNPSFWINKGNP